MGKGEGNEKKNGKERIKRKRKVGVWEMTRKGAKRVREKTRKGRRIRKRKGRGKGTRSSTLGHFGYVKLH